MMSGLGDQPYSNSASVEVVAGIGESTSETDVTIQQSV